MTLDDVKKIMGFNVMCSKATTETLTKFNLAVFHDIQWHAFSLTFDTLYHERIILKCDVRSCGFKKKIIKQNYEYTINIAVIPSGDFSETTECRF